MRGGTVWTSLVLAMVLAAGGIAAGGEPDPEPADAKAIVSPLRISVQSIPRVVRAADGLQHLAYELFIVNQDAGTTTIDSIAAVDPADEDTIVYSYDADTLPSALRLTNGSPGTTFAPGTSAYALMDVELPASARVPRTLSHRFQLTYQGVANPETGAVPAPLQLDFVGVPSRVDTRKPVVVRPPLAGSGWVVGNGCCHEINSHRAATLSLDGTVHVPERFAIDFVQLGANGALAQGDASANEDFGYFGDEIYSVADGKVVRIQDGIDNLAPGALPANPTVQTAGGNYAVVDLGHGRYALYAHLQPGSLEVKVGDRLKAGDVIGLLGNTGNTDAPHLHFHVMDSKSPLLSDGLPFEFTSFVGEGVVTDEEALEDFPAQPTPVDTTVYAGPHRKELPINLEVVRFPSPPR